MASITLLAGSVGILSIDSTVTVTGASVLSVQESIAGEATTAFTVAVDVSAVKAMIVVSTIDCILETNSASSPAHTLNLLANQPYVWHTNSYDTFKFTTTDITSLHFTVAGATAGTVTLEVITDPTP